ncbi:MAG: thiosulfate oxidation carrier complex protein SoxZ [Betaproteobacteria bacterium]|nr:MAG: thiosulfate oxidation carrier complex protein SoxZ [Betaproteobacteria bacterium]
MKSRLGKARLRVPKKARRGDVIEIRVMVEHPMESGFRHDNVGKLVPRHIATDFYCRYNGREVFRAILHPAVSTNPYFSFYLVAQETGELVFSWADDRGGTVTETAQLTVS